MTSPFLLRDCRSKAEAQAEIEQARFQRLADADKLDDLIVAAKFFKLKLLAAHKYPADPAEARQWRRQHRSYIGCFDLEDEIGLMTEVIEQLECEKRIQER